MTLKARIEAALGVSMTTLTRLHGGDLSEVQRVVLMDGTRAVAKTGPMVAVEGRMLQAMQSAGAPVPAALYCSSDLLLLEHLETTHVSAEHWQILGSALRQLHNQTGPHYGWEEDYAFSAVIISNAPSQNWPEFWLERRLLAEPQTFPPDIRRRLEQLSKRLPDILPAAPPAAFLHGDLWAGNVLFGNNQAYLIDPACYYGDAEVDLAMLTLFGSPPDSFWDGYGSLKAGIDARRPTYQLWPALTHLRLFGAGYHGMVSRLLEQTGF